MKQTIYQHPSYQRGLQRGRGHRAKIKQTYHWWNKPRTIRIKKWTIVIGAYILWTFIPKGHAQTIYADPPTINVPKPAVIKPIEQPKIEEMPQMEQVPVAAPTPVAAAPSASGCVSGYRTGQYALDQIIIHESGGNSCATNPGGCFGLLQACPGAPLRAACGGDPTCQIAWFQANKTGGRSWEAIWALWQTQGYW